MNPPQSHENSEAITHTPVNLPPSLGRTETNVPQQDEGAELSNVNALTERIIGSAIEVHRCLGPGLSEATYQVAMRIE